MTKDLTYPLNLSSIVLRSESGYIYPYCQYQIPYLQQSTHQIFFCFHNVCSFGILDILLLVKLSQKVLGQCTCKYKLILLSLSVYDSYKPKQSYLIIAPHDFCDILIGISHVNLVHCLQRRYMSVKLSSDRKMHIRTTIVGNRSSMKYSTTFFTVSSSHFSKGSLIPLLSSAFATTLDVDP